MTTTTENNLRKFRWLAIASLIAVYLLFVIGSSVRASGAGMGCPDWPKCFGQFIPPTDVSQLPTDYQQIYADRGYKNTTFNAVKTWTEYGNRLSSAVIGLLVLATAIFGFLLRKTHRLAWYGSLGALINVIFNAWLGSVVIASNLHPAIITTHMFLGILTIASLWFAVSSINIQKWQLPKQHIKILMPASFFVGCLLIIQIGLGTQVRAALENNQLTEYANMVLFSVPAISPFINMHAIWGTISLIATALMLLFMARNSWSYANKKRHQNITAISLTAAITNLLLGFALSFIGFAWGKPLHLLVAIIAVSGMLLLFISCLHSFKK